jgi:hypothetical protein
MFDATGVHQEAGAGCTPPLDGVIVLGLIVLIRTFLSMALQVELEGHWPWERARTEAQKRSSV